MHKGIHLLIDCRNVSREICLDDQRILAVMARAAEKAGATVISQVRYSFGEGSPPGFAAVVLLDESHCTVHSYADLGLVAMDIFTCGRTDPQTVLDFVLEELDLGEFSVQRVKRLETRDEMSRLAGISGRAV